ncbi:MAG: T9SS type A sorting domain-containing protein, partial [Bacteroidia bacterium]|nr:T9SS type A sorting domain-containing protein [Bacteroidia bacterium]
GSAETFGVLLFTTAGTKTLLSDISCSGNLTINAGSGAFIGNSFNCSVGGNWLDNSTFTCGTGTVTFTGAAAQTILKTGGETFNHIAFSGAGTKTLLATITANGNLTINAGSGAFIANTFNISVAGNWTNSGGTFTPGNTTQTFNGAAAQTISKTASTETFGILLFTTGGTKTLLSNISSTGNLTINAGSGALIANAFSISVGGNWTDNSTFTAGTGTVTFNGAAAQTLIKTGGETFNHLVFSAAGTKTLLSQVFANGNITINAGSGAVIANNFNTTLAGNWTNNGGTFTPGTSTTTFNGAAAQTIFKSGGETFNNLLFSGANTVSLLSAVTANGTFTINSTSTFDVSASNFQVTIGGNYTNNGIFTSQSGTVLLNGAVLQTIGGTSITTFYNLTLNNTGGANLATDQMMTSTLTLSNGTLNTNSKNFTFLSTATETARIAAITGTGDISGNIIMQRFAPGGTTGWALLGAPLTSALSMAAWNDDFAITCASCPNGYPGSFTSIYSYDETVGGAFDNVAAYTPISTITNPITNGIGYWVYLGNGQTTTTDITIDVIGTPRKFSYTLPLSYTNTGSAANDGWNLISNPYPSPIQWSLLKGATANIDNAIYVFNADLNGGAGSFAAFVNGISSPAVGSGGVGDNIAISQAFYVHSTGATSLSALETNKVSANPTFLRTASPQSATTMPLLRLNLDGGSSYHDETVLYEQAGSTNDFDAGFDAIKMGGQDPLAPWIALENNSTNFSINGVPSVQNNFSMNLKTITGYTGSYTISAPDLTTFPPGACISLYDKFLNSTTDLRAGSYTFNLADTTTVSRFLLSITINPLAITSSFQDPSCIAPNSGEIIATGTNSGPWNYVWTDSNGTIVQNTINKNGADTLKNISGGTFEVQVNTVGSCDNNTTQFTLNAADLAQSSFSVTEDTLYLSQGATGLFTNSSSNAISFLWNFGDGIGSSTAQDTSYTYTSAGTYSVTLIAYSPTTCGDTSSVIIYVDGTVLGTLQNFSNAGSVTLSTIEKNNYNLNFNLKENTDLVFTIFDQQGKFISSVSRKNQKNFSENFNLQSSAKGLYFIRVNSSSETRTFKVLVD